MKLKRNIAAALLPLLLSAFLGVLLSANVSGAADAPSLWGSSAWWDWSDYRGAAGIRVFFARFSAGSLDDPTGLVGGGAIGGDLKTHFGMVGDPEPFREFWAEWYIDRLGIRLSVMEDSRFRGRLGSDAPVVDPITGVQAPGNPVRSSELETNTFALGVDLDLIRYPFLRLGIDYDYYFGEIKLHDRRSPNLYEWTVFEVEGRQPMTVGIHGLAIPTRIRGVPVTVQSRFRFPVPLVQTSGPNARLTQFEISGGLRPAIWETSLYAHSTFSVGLSGGYKWVGLESDVVSHDGRKATLKARWQGAFIELGLNF